MGDDSDKSKDANSKSDAVQRLDMIRSHVAPKSNAKPSKKNRGAELPADWSDVLGELDLVRKFARTPKYETTGYIRQKEAGKLWVRERLELLLDPGTFEEVGSAAGTAAWSKPPGPKHSIIEEEREVVTDFTPSNNVQGTFFLCRTSGHNPWLTVWSIGFGKIRGRQVLVAADDFTLRAGHADGALMAKTLYMEKLCVHLKLPMIKLVDGASGGGSITTYRTQAGTYLPELELLSWLVRKHEPQSLSDRLSHAHSNR